MTAWSVPGLGLLLDPSTIGVTPFPASTDNATLLQQDYQQQQAAAQAAAVAAATPAPTSSPVTDLLIIAGLAALGWYGWKHGWFDSFLSGMGGMSL